MAHQIVTRPWGARLAGMALAGGMALALPLLATTASAQPAEPKVAASEARPAAAGEPRGVHAARGEHPRFHGAQGEHRRFHGPQGEGPRKGMHRQQGPFAGLKLTQAQRDQLFKIRHDSAPVLREQRQAAQTARQSLRELVQADRFDEARARELTSAAAQAQAATQLRMAQDQHRMRAVLTAEQRTQLDQRRRAHGERPAAGR